MRGSLVLAAVWTLASPACALAQDHHHATAQSDNLKWAAPAAYAPGFLGPQYAPLTVLSGSFNIGTGDKLDESKGTTVKAGGYSFVMKGMTHYAWFTEDTVLQLHGMGPQGVTYVDPADDPRKK